MGILIHANSQYSFYNVPSCKIDSIVSFLQGVAHDICMYILDFPKLRDERISRTHRGEGGFIRFL